MSLFALTPLSIKPVRGFPEREEAVLKRLDRYSSTIEIDDLLQKIWNGLVDVRMLQDGNQFVGFVLFDREFKLISGSLPVCKIHKLYILNRELSKKEVYVQALFETVGHYVTSWLETVRFPAILLTINRQHGIHPLNINLYQFGFQPTQGLQIYQKLALHPLSGRDLIFELKASKLIGSCLSRSTNKIALIKLGFKTLEIITEELSFTREQVNLIVFYSPHLPNFALCQIMRHREYSSFQELCDNEDLTKSEPICCNQEKAIKSLQDEDRIKYQVEQNRKLSVVSIQCIFTKINDFYSL